MHTSPFFLLSLAEYWSIHNHGASVAVVFVVYTYHLGGIRGLIVFFRRETFFGCEFLRMLANLTNSLATACGASRENLARDTHRMLTPPEIAGTLMTAARSSIIRRIDLP
jgi:hypothetical protein